MLRKAGLYKISVRNFGTKTRNLATQTAAKLEDDREPHITPVTTKTAWENAKPFSEIPGPSRLHFLLNSFPGGKYHNLSLAELHQVLNKQYGPVALLKGYFGKEPTLFTFDPQTFEYVFRTEGPWPNRPVFESFLVYRKNYRQDIYSGFLGLSSSQGKDWGTARSMVNPILLKPKNVNLYIPKVDKTSTEFVKRIAKLRDPTTLEVPPTFKNEANRWSLESIAVIALNTRLGLLNDDINSERGEELMAAFKEFFELVLQIEFQPPSLWKYYEPPSYKRIMKVYDKITDITLYLFREARKRIESERKTGETIESDSMLAQFLETSTENVAMVMSMDMIFAGVDTTYSAFMTTLFYLAKNPDKQDRLREEVLKILPEKDTPLTEESLRNLPYLRAVIKETQRISPVVVGTTRRTVQDLVVNGYQVPKGTQIVLSSCIASRKSEYVDQPDKFLPERWLRERSQESCPESKMKHPFAYFPFGFGPRMCVGKRLAQLELETVFLRIIRNFRVEWHYPDIKYKMNIISSPVGDLKFKFIDTEK